MNIPVHVNPYTGAITHMNLASASGNAGYARRKRSNLSGAKEAMKMAPVKRSVLPTKKNNLNAAKQAIQIPPSKKVQSAVNVPRPSKTMQKIIEDAIKAGVDPATIEQIKKQADAEERKRKETIELYQSTKPVDQNGRDIFKPQFMVKDMNGYNTRSYDQYGRGI